MLRTRWFLLFPILALFLMGFQTQPAQLRLDSPLPGEALQGTVAVRGSTDLPAFESADVYFSYAQAAPDSWFLLVHLTAPLKEGLLAQWDTTTLTDGSYRLKLRVNLQGGGISDVIVSDLRVRNYTPIETSTPTAPSSPLIHPTGTPTPTAIFTPTLGPTPTPLPTNPASLLRSDLFKGTAFALAAVGVAFLFLSIYFFSHHARRRL